MQIITSKDNNFIKNIKKLKEKKYRDSDSEYVVEGIKMCEEAIKYNEKIKKIILCEDCEKNSEISKATMYEIAKFDCVYVTREIFKTLTDVVNPQGIIAVIEKGKKEKEIDYVSQSVIVALDDIQDPGNLGTIIRTIDSCGLNQLIVSSKTADCYNPKVVRSTMGAIFRVKVIQCDDLGAVIKESKKHKFKAVVSSLDAQKTIYEIDYKKKFIVIGNEANGVNEKIQELSDEKIKIPMIGKSESLNASVATGIILYEYVRQNIYNSKTL